MTIRIFRDSVKPHLISLDGTDGVLAYANGDFIWPSDQIQRFTGAGKQLARIDVNGTAWTKARILDVEKFDATPEIAKEWIPKRNEFRGDATIYTSRSALDELFAECAGLHYWIIVADWTGFPHPIRMPLPKGVRFAGTQFASTARWDVTAIYDDHWLPRR